MWFKKKVEQVKCADCKHYIDKCDAQVVNCYWEEVYYCPIHKKPYDKMRYTEVYCKNAKCNKGFNHFHDKTVYYKLVPEHYEEVKIKEKK